jgi:hypothetical protein
MKKLILLLLFLSFFEKSQAQIGINSTNLPPATNAMLDISSTTKGLLIPRMTTSQRTTLLASATDGLTVYDTETKSFWFYNSATAVWTALATGGPWLGAGTNIYNTNTGNVGIGTSAPLGKLHIESAGFSTPTNSETNPHLRMKLTNNANYLWNRFENSDGTRSFSHRYDLFDNTASNYSTYFNAIRLFSINYNGNVGIGPNLGIYKLDVAGDINTTGNFRANGNAGIAGDILKKDASNLLSWQPQFTGFMAQGTAPAVSNEQLVAPNTDTKVTILNNEEFDSNSLYNPASGDITIATAGIYHIDVKLHIDNADAGTHRIFIDRQPSGGAFATIRYTTHEIVSSNSDLPMAISADFQFFAGDIVKIVYSHNCTTNQTITGSYFSWVNMHKLN